MPLGYGSSEQGFVGVNCVAKDLVASSVVVGARSSRRSNTSSEEIEESHEGFDEASLSTMEISLEPELDIIIRDISQTIDCLYRISIHLTQRSANQHGAKVAAIDVSLFEDYDTEYLREKYPSLPEFLVARIGKAISRRRQYLTYRELHARKLRSHLEGEKDTDTLSILTRTTATTFRSQSGLDESLTSTRPDSRLTIMSETTYATLAANTDRITMPDVPKDALQGAPFECPICRKMHQLSEDRPTQEWHRHVFRDLRPYICTFEDCTAPDTDYESRHSWFSHERKQHRVSWSCRGHCDQSFHTREEFKEHILVSKPVDIDAMQISAFMDMCSLPMRESSESQCPFCQGILEGAKSIEKHIGHHLEEVALFALPRSIFNDDEGESDLESSIEPTAKMLDTGAKDTGEPVDYETTRDRTSEQTIPYVAEDWRIRILEELKHSVIDWKGYDLASFGELLRHGTFPVTRDEGSSSGRKPKREVTGNYKAYLFRRIVLFCKASVPKGRKVSKVAESNGQPDLRLKGRIFLGDLTDVLRTYQAHLDSFRVQLFWRGDPGIETVIVDFLDLSTANDWCDLIEEQRRMIIRMKHQAYVYPPSLSPKGQPADLPFENPRPAPAIPNWPLR